MANGMMKLYAVLFVPNLGVNLFSKEATTEQSSEI
jgi:hypothetical protein